MIKSVCVYCGSSNHVAQSYLDAATSFGTLLAEEQLTLVYGGGRVGLMGKTADAALENGGAVIGIIPGHLQTKEVEHNGVTELHIVESMHSRKQMMVDKSDAFVVLPGGLGSLDELFEILTWKMLGLHDKPIVIANIDGYWDELVTLIDKLIQEGFCRPQHKNMYRVVTDIHEILPTLRSMPAETFDPKIKWS